MVTVVALAAAAPYAGTALVVSASVESPDAVVSLASHEWERLPAAVALSRRYPRACRSRKAERTWKRWRSVSVGVVPATATSPSRPELWWTASYDRAYVRYEWAAILYCLWHRVLFEA